MPSVELPADDLMPEIIQPRSSSVSSAARVGITETLEELVDLEEPCSPRPGADGGSGREGLPGAPRAEQDHGLPLLCPIGKKGGDLRDGWRLLSRLQLSVDEQVRDARLPVSTHAAPRRPPRAWRSRSRRCQGSQSTDSAIGHGSARPASRVTPRGADRPVPGTGSRR